MNIGDALKETGKATKWGCLSCHIAISTEGIALIRGKDGCCDDLLFTAEMLDSDKWEPYH